MAGDRAMGQRIRAARLAQQMSQKEVAASVGVTGAQISNIERGVYGTTRETLHRIAAALHVSVDALLSGEAPPATTRRRLRPPVVCLCGSTRFGDAFRAANLRLTLAGEIVLTIGCDFKSDDALGLTDADKARMDELHLRKIDMADYVLALNVGGYVGERAAREVAYAVRRNTPVRWLESLPGSAIPQLDAASYGRVQAALAEEAPTC